MPFAYAIASGLTRLAGADPLAALGMTYFLVPEGREVWEGEECHEL